MVKEQNKWLVPGAIVLGALIVLAGLVWAINAFSFKLATVDIQKIEQKSSIIKQLNAEVQAKGKELSAKFKTAKTDKEKQAINAEFEKFKAQKQEEFTTKVKAAIKKVAGKKGYKAVATSNQVYLYTSYDITDEVIKELAK